MNKNFALINCNVFDGDVKSDIKKNMTILVEITQNDKCKTGQIYKIGKSDEITIPEGFDIIDVNQKYVIPGLINAHVHLYGTGKPMKTFQSEHGMKILQSFFETHLGKSMIKKIEKSNALLYLKSGVTTIRCVGEVPYNDVRIRNEINRNKYLGPRILACGPILNITGGHGEIISVTSDSPWEARKRVREIVRNGVDWIKICAREE